MSFIECAHLGVTSADTEELGVRNGGHCRTNSRQNFIIGIGPLTRPKCDLVGDNTCDRRTTDATEVRSLDHDGHAGSQFNLISSLIDDHVSESWHVVDNRLYVTENDAGLILISSEAHDGERFPHRDEWLEVDKAGDETGD